MHANWYTTLTIYFIVCDDLSNPANGSVNTVGTFVNDSATFFCDNGYDLIGDGTITCQSSGSWSGPPPVCEG